MVPEGSTVVGLPMPPPVPPMQTPKVEPKQRELGKVVVLIAAADGSMKPAAKQPPVEMRTYQEVHRFIKQNFPDGGEFVVVREMGTVKFRKVVETRLVDG